MAAYMSHNDTEHATTVHHLVLDDNELHTVVTALEHVVAGGGMPANHQIHEVLEAARRGVRVFGTDLGRSR